MKNKTVNVFFDLAFTIPFMLATAPAPSQHADPIISERIAITTRPAADSIMLRWAPLTFKEWQWGNTRGYRVERYVLVRDESLLPRPEKLILHPSVTPLPEAGWERLVADNKYAAIAAQALYGDRFELDLKEGDVFTIINKVRENEQRFAFALFSADMSPTVARASGLWFTDKQVKKGEKYLYRVVINSMDSLRGSTFVSPDDPYLLPKPQGLKGEFTDQVVSLRWNKSETGYYTAHIVERSEDGIVFESITESPLVTVSPTEKTDTRYEYAIDSLKDLSVTYHYRVKGITSFGEQSAPSNVVSGKGMPSVDAVPYISAVENLKNTSLLIRWDFPATLNDAISGFSIERSSKPKSTYSPVTKYILSPDRREFEDARPGQINYYRVTALGLDGELFPSQVYFAQLVDSIPPASPLGLAGKINDEGTVILSWQRNTEPDIYGYRVYKANYKSEELAQITSEPIAPTSFTDHVDLNTLNETVYYSVMAVDVNQNHSGLSQLLKIDLPDKIRPQPPVFHPVKSKPSGISLSWTGGGSEDIVRYRLYRKGGDQLQWEQIAIVEIIEDLADTVHTYLDESAVPGDYTYYTIVSVDDAGLESEPAHPVSGSRISINLPAAIQWKKPRMNREQDQITLVWSYNQPGIQSFKVYRAVDHHQPVLFKTVAGQQKEFTDTMIPGRHYTYRIMALFADGNKSSMSEEIEFQY